MITQVSGTPRRLGQIPSFSSDFIDSEIFTADFIMSALAQKAVMVRHCSPHALFTYL
jgi:hypothetical protein